MGQKALVSQSPGRCAASVTGTDDSVEERDAMLQSGMEEGATETWERLSEYLRVLAERVGSQ